MIQKMNFNYDKNSDDSLKTKEELTEEKQNKIFVNGMLKRMNQKNYI